MLNVPTVKLKFGTGLVYGNYPLLRAAETPATNERTPKKPASSGEEIVAKGPDPAVAMPPPPPRTSDNAKRKQSR